MDLSKYLIIIGFCILILGVINYFFNIFSFFGKTFADFKYEGSNFKIYFPLGSMFVLSIFLTVIFNLFNKLYK